MVRVAGGLAAPLWIVGVVVLILGLLDLPADVTVRSATPGGGFLIMSNVPAVELAVGTVLVGVGGMLTAGLVLVRRRRPFRRM